MQSAKYHATAWLCTDLYFTGTGSPAMLLPMKLLWLAFFYLAVPCLILADSARDELAAARLVENATVTRFSSSARSTSDRAELVKVKEIYEGLAKKYPRDATVRAAYGAFLWQIEQREEAVAQWRIGEELDPKNAEIVSRLGGAFLEFGSAKKATLYFERSSKLAPQNPLYRFNFGNALFLFRHEMIDEQFRTADAVAQRALDEFRAASTLDPFNSEFVKAYAEGFYFVESPDWNQAVTAWKRYLDLTPTKNFAYANLARVNLKLGFSSEARTYLNLISGSEFDNVKGALTRQLDAQEKIKRNP